MKRILLFVACCLSLSVYAQESLMIAEGDLNKDGVADKVVFKPEQFYGDNFAFYFGDGKGGYTLFREYYVGLFSGVQLSINDKGIVRIQHGSEGYCDVFLFRYEDGDFRCTGGKIDRHNNLHYDISYNFLTGKMVRTDGEGKGKQSVTSDMYPIPVLKFGWFPLDFDAVGYLFEENDFEGGVEFKTTMGIFRLMQQNEMLFYDFADYGYPHYPPDVDANGSAAFYGEVMRYGRYNCWLNVFILKQDDGAYHIDVSEEYEDRSYELYLNEDADNLEEAIQKADEERGGESAYSMSETEWLFKDGQFTLISEKHEKPAD